MIRRCITKNDHHYFCQSIIYSKSDRKYQLNYLIKSEIINTIDYISKAMLNEQLDLEDAIELVNDLSTNKIIHSPIQALDEVHLILIEKLFNRVEYTNPDQRNNLRKVLHNYNLMKWEARNFISDNGTATIANMILWSDGKLNWEIKNSRELDIVLQFWEDVGYQGVDKDDILRYITSKKGYHKARISRDEDGILTRLKSVFGSLFSKDPKFPIEFTFHLIPEKYKATRNGIFENMSNQDLNVTLDNLDHLISISPNFVYRDNVKYAVFRRYNYECAISDCNEKENLRIHHIIPRACGGSDMHSNLIALCKSCHHQVHFPTEKHNRWPGKC